MALSDQQRQFVQTFLKGGFFHKKSDAKKVARFETFLDLKAEVDRLIATFAGITVDVGPVQVRLDAGQDKADSGDFKDAVAQAEAALALAREVEADIAVRRQQCDTLRQQLNALAANPVGALVDELTDIEGKRTVATDLLADDVPVSANITAFGPALDQLRQTLQTVSQAAVLRAAQKKTLTDGHAENAARVVTIRAVLARATADAQHGALDAAATVIEDDLAAMALAAGGTDPVAIVAKLADLSAMPARIDTLQTDVNAALSRVLTAQLGNTGTTDAQKEKLVALGKADPQAFAAATAVLESINADMGDTVADRALIELRIEAVATAQSAFDTKLEAWEAADTVKDDALADQAQKAKTLSKANKTGVAKRAELAAFKKTNAAALADPSHPQHAVLIQQQQALQAEDTACFEAYTQAKQAKVVADTAVVTATSDASQLKSEALLAQAALNTSKKERDQAEGKKWLLDAIGFGPLSPDNGKPVPPAVAKDLIALYGRNPRIADAAVSSARAARDPASVAATAALVIGKVDTKFKNGTTQFVDDAFCEDYAMSLVQTSAALAPADAAKLGPYLEQGRHFAEIDGIVPEDSRNDTGVKRTQFVGNAMLKPGGTLDFAAGRDAVLDVLFHPEALDAPTPRQAAHMLDTMDFLEGSAAAQGILTGATAPTSDGAARLLAISSGKAVDAVGEEETRSAILNAMLTPVFQGNVGSCFATAGIVKLRNDDPLEAMKNYRDLAQDGVYTPKTGDPVPAVNNIAPGNDPLVRSLEYSAATAIAQADFSGINAGLQNSVDAMIGVVLSGVKSKAKADVTARLENAIKGALTLVYDPEIELPSTAGDGSSTKGCYRMKNTRDDSFITDMDQYRDLVFDLVQEEVTKKDTKLFKSVTDVGNLVNLGSFAQAAEINGKLPWELPSGGQTQEASKTIFGGDIEAHPTVQRVPLAGVDVAKRSEEILSRMVTDFVPSTDPPNPKELATVLVQSIHGFNVTPGDASLAPLRAGGPDRIAANIDALLTQPAADLAATPIPVDRLAYMFEQEMTKLGKDASGAAKTALDDILANQTPTTQMTPAAFKTHVKAASAAFVTAKATAEADEWAANQSVAPSNEAIAKEKAEWVTYLDHKVDAAVSQTLIEDLGAPQFTFADTNWGDAAGHTYFVMVGDPVSGETRLFAKTDPSGVLSPLKDADKWVADGWQKVA